MRDANYDIMDLLKMEPYRAKHILSLSSSPIFTTSSIFTTSGENTTSSDMFDLIVCIFQHNDAELRAMILNSEILDFSVTKNGLTPYKYLKSIVYALDKNSTYVQRLERLKELKVSLLINQERVKKESV